MKVAQKTVLFLAICALAQGEDIITVITAGGCTYIEDDIKTFLQSHASNDTNTWIAWAADRRDDGSVSQKFRRRIKDKLWVLLSSLSHHPTLNVTLQ